MQVNPAICSIEKNGMDQADKIIAVSNFTRDILIRNYHISPEKITTVYNAAEPVPAGIRKELITASGEKIVTFLGRITMQKGPEYFIDAASLVLRRMKNVRFVMAGKGDLRQAMIQRATELNIAEFFDFPGFLSDEEVIRLFHRSDLFVMPSVSEPFGIVALEAIQANLPVIISRQSGVSEVLNHVLKVDYWDVNALAEAMYYLLNDQIFVENMVVQSKFEVNKLLWKNSATLVRDLYHSMLNELSTNME
jgi:glycosyltransferase involved in cell wall biosynthesis